ncbi:MAG: PEP-CTERM sorting domain-containing protein, partial [Aeoliella sp.]
NWVGNDGGPSPGTPAEVEDQFELINQVPPNPDFNGDNIVNALDYVRWRDNQGKMGTGTQMTGDANGDTNVDALDYESWRTHFGGPPPTGSPNKAVDHLINYTNQDPKLGPTRVPDGVVEYQPVLNPNNSEDGSVFPSATEHTVARVDIFVDSPTIQRNTMGLRNVFGATTLDIVELGLYNSDFRGFGMRAVLWVGSSPNWQFFDFDLSYDDDGSGIVEQDEIVDEFGSSWHTWEATITETSITATVDLNRDGMNNATNTPGVDATLVFDQTTNPGFALNFGFNNLRIGGPSNLYTTRHAIFDNVFLSGPQDIIPGSLSSANIPEPSTLVIAALAALGFVASRRRNCG